MTIARVRPETCLSDLQLDRVACGELARSQVDGHLSSCAACLARLDELAEAHRRLAPEMTARRPGWRPRWRRGHCAGAAR